MPLLGQVPLDPLVREGGDVGGPVVVVWLDSDAATAVEALAGRVAVLRPSRVRHPDLKVVSS